MLLSSLFLWTGFLLVLVPWSVFWERNYFAQTLPAVQMLVSNNYLRGAISGLGLVNVYVGLAELVTAIMSRPVRASSISPRE